MWSEVGTSLLRCLLSASIVGVFVSGSAAQAGAATDGLEEGTKPMSRCCLRTTGAVLATGTAGAFVALDQAWYAQYDRGRFHFFNDGEEWMQMDKTGHFFSTYTLGSWSSAMLRHCGMQQGRSRWIGGSVGLVLLSGVEVLDGTSDAWGFSVWDMAANTGGAALFIGQDALWNEQRIRPKLSAHLTDYAAMRPDLLGEGTAERILKDYNGLTLWLSGNISSLSGSEVVPSWFSVAIGYGAEGMTTAMEPKPGEGPAAAPWYRQIYISPDIDLTRVRVRSKALRTVLFVLNSIKVPAPAVEFRSDGRVLGHWIYF